MDVIHFQWAALCFTNLWLLMCSLQWSPDPLVPGMGTHVPQLGGGGGFVGCDYDPPLRSR